MNAVVLANDRQLQRGSHIAGLFLVVWGGMFGGIPLAILMNAKSRIDSALFLLFPLLGFAAFFGGLYLVLRRKEVRLDASRACVEECTTFLGSASTKPYERKLFDRVQLSVETGNKGAKSYRIALRGAGAESVSLGDFPERGEALTAGMRAAREAGFAFEEQRGDGTTLALAPAQLLAVPAVQAPSGLPWWRQRSAVALVAANVVPVLGVLFWGWQVFSVMLLFWLENVVIGLFNVVKILLARPDAEQSDQSLPFPFSLLGNLFIAGFFTVHYGMFCAGHGLFIVTMFGKGRTAAGPGFDIPDLPAVIADVVLRNGLIWAAIALVVSHGVSFYANFLAPRAYQGAKAEELMFAPYKRIVILHVVIILGGFFAMSQAGSVVPLLLLIGLKVAVDLESHRREHAVPYEREMRDFMAEHGHQFVRANEPGAAGQASEPRESIADLNDKPLAHYFGTWRAEPQVSVPPGWLARADFRAAGGGVKVKLWSQADHGLADEGEFDALVRGNAARVGFIEVRQHAGGRMRVARFTGSNAADERVDMNEIQHPEGNPTAMQARSLALRRA